MNTPHDERLPGEQALLDHYRQQAEDAPSAELDALILRAARQALPPRPSRLAQLFGWLQRPQRFAMAFGSLASMALVLGLVLKGLPQAPLDETRQTLHESLPALPQQRAAPAPAATTAPQAEARVFAAPPPPAAQDAAPPAAASAPRPLPSVSRPQPLLPLPVEPAPAAERARQQAKTLQSKAAARAHAPRTAAPVMAAPAPPEAASASETELDRALDEVLRLQQLGHTASAQALMQRLAEQYPGQDLAARLQQRRAAAVP